MIKFAFGKKLPFNLDSWFGLKPETKTLDLIDATFNGVRVERCHCDKVGPWWFGSLVADGPIPVYGSDAPCLLFIDPDDDDPPNRADLSHLIRYGRP